MAINRKILSISMLLLLTGCLKPFEPEIDVGDQRFLVVEAALDITDDIGVVILSRTMELEALNEKRFESGAEVWVENEAGDQLMFMEEKAGNYVGNFSGFDIIQKLRLNIITSANQHFISEYVPVVASPPIDSLVWEAEEDELKFYVNTHDPENKTRYYRWEFVETAEYNSLFASNGIYDMQLEELIVRDQSTQNIHICWAEEVSTKVIIGNTTRLAEDIIVDKEVWKLSSTSWKHRFKYSLLVKQFGMTAEEYDYWYNIQQSNESVGSIFESQPSNIGSNIKFVGADDVKVFGFFSVHITSEKRVFIKVSELPQWMLRSSNIPVDCGEEDVAFVDIDSFYENPAEYPVYQIQYDLVGNIIGITTAPVECIDCSYAGRGSTIKPDYWE